MATDELRRSTEAIQKQTDVLELQYQALDRLIQKRKKNETQRRDLETVQHRKIETERKHLIGEVLQSTSITQFPSLTLSGREPVL